MACSSDVNVSAAFSEGLKAALPPIYLTFGILSLLSVGIVFLTYCLFPRLRGISSSIFLMRAGLDSLISIGDIATFWITRRWDTGANYAIGCTVIGTFNQFGLFAANLLYVGLVIDLIRAIRNPFKASSMSSKTFVAVVFAISGTLAFLVYLIPSSDACVAKDIGQTRASSAGLSMFYWCWVNVQTDVKRFVLVTLLLFYLLNVVLTAAALIIVTWGLSILVRYSGATGITRKQIVRQNSVFVIVFGIETLLRTSIWIAGLATAEQKNGSLNFASNASLGLAVVFALIHSCRGMLDLLVWRFTFSIGIKDAKELCAHIAERFHERNGGGSMPITRPLLLAPPSSDSMVNYSLRRDVVYCFTFGILHSIREEEVTKQRKSFVGSVRDDFVGHVMVQWDSNNRDQEIEDRHQDPEYVEQEEQKIRFPPSASYRSFTFIDIKPKLFALLRRVFGVSNESYKESFKIDNVADVESSGMLEKFTEGKSGSFFYFTRDYRYIIKTITHSEEVFLKKFLFSYYEHMKANPSSIIVHFYGLHKVRLAPGQKYISVIVMNNIFHNEEGLSVHERYDLKGSRVGRSVLKGKESKDKKKLGTLKDLDLNKPVVIGPNNKEQLMDQLRQDLEFLREHNIMDYSLLLGMHHHSDTASTALQRETGVQLSKGATPFLDVSVELEGTECPLTDPRGNQVSRSDSMLSNGRDSRSNRTVDLPFFRRDYGGLRSYSPHHPLFVSEATQRYMTCIPSEGYKGIGTDELPIDTYYFVVVDILQEYNASKKVEHHFKTKVLRQSDQWISAVNPTYYAQRFLEAMDRIFD